MGRPINDITGQTFGKLTPYKWAGYQKGEKQKHSLWHCRCECGKVIVVLQGWLRSGKKKTCGCYRRTPMQVAINTIYSDYRKRAQKKQQEFSISKEAMAEMLLKPCTYCGYVPKAAREPSGPIEGNSKWLGGLDRLDNSKGYTLDNVVPCCAWCNYARRDRETASFREWSIRLGKQQLIQAVSMTLESGTLDISRLGSPAHPKRPGHA